MSVSNLMYVKEDLVLPHNMSFYDLIISKARGKSGPLFHFDVYDDIRLEHNANVEKEESHAGQTRNSRNLIAFCSPPSAVWLDTHACALHPSLSVKASCHCCLGLGQRR